jgi:hypothetical protein
VGINVRTETEDGEALSECEDPRGLTKALPAPPFGLQFVLPSLRRPSW